uniref:SFRICE_006227 n=1 Tax=Spodoptera frugiperda TaxID=7108 RepID=A0A2H1W584_SPOFR
MGKKSRKRIEEVMERVRELEDRTRKRNRRSHLEEYEAHFSRSRSSRHQAHSSRSRSPRCRQDEDHFRSPTPQVLSPGEEEEETSMVEVCPVPISEDNNALPADIEELLGRDGVPVSVCKRWNAVLQDGLTTDTKVNLVKKYDPSQSCFLLISPKLNEEVGAALSEAAIK